MLRNFRFPCLPALALLLFSPNITWSQDKPASAATAAPPPSHNASCTINTTPPTEADNAYIKGDYKKAGDLYAAALKTNPNDDHSHEGSVRTLLAQSKVTEAAALTDEWTKTATHNADAALAAGEVRYAEGDVIEAYAILLKAATFDPCKAAIYDELALFENLGGYFATARKHLVLAHQLDPKSEEIKSNWIDTLPRSQRIAEYHKYLDETKLLTDKQRKAYTKGLQQLETHAADRCTLVSTKGSAIIPLKPVTTDIIGIDSWGLEVFFNGHSRILQIDTGASGATLTFSAGAGLGLTNGVDSHVYGAGDEGNAGVSIMHAGAIRVGNVEFQNCPVEVLHKAGVLGGGTEIGSHVDDIDGLIGTDVFARYLVTLDYINHQLRLDPLPRRPDDITPPSDLDAMGGHKSDDDQPMDRYIAPAMKNWTSIYRDGHLLLMPTRINKTGAKLFVIDTGAAMNIISPDVAKEVTTTQTNELISVSGLSGKSSKVFETGKFTMDFAGLRLPVHDMDAMDTTKFSHPVGISGFIGYPTLIQLVMHIDYRDNLVLFEAPGAKH